MSRVQDSAAGPAPEETDAEWLPTPGVMTGKSPGEKLVYAALTELGEASGLDIVEAVSLSPGTVYPALREFKHDGIAESRPKLDGNGQYWTLVDDAELNGGDPA